MQHNHFNCPKTITTGNVVDESYWSTKGLTGRMSPSSTVRRRSSVVKSIRVSINQEDHRCNIITSTVRRRSPLLIWSMGGHWWLLSIRLAINQNDDRVNVFISTISKKCTIGGVGRSDYRSILIERSDQHLHVNQTIDSHQWRWYQCINSSSRRTTLYLHRKYTKIYDFKMGSATRFTHPKMTENLTLHPEMWEVTSISEDKE